MFKNVHYNLLHVIIVLVILGRIQGHCDERLEERSIEHELSDENKPLVLRGREFLPVEHESRVKNPITDDNGYIESDGKIIFPSDLNKYATAEHKFDASSVTTCKNTTFCEYPPLYPQDFIKTAIGTRRDLKFLATVDTAPDIGQRIDADNNDEPLCVSEDIVVFPKSAENKAKQWLYVINEDNFAQGVRIETCVTKNTACSNIIEGLADGYKTFCKQKFIYRQLAAVSTNGSVGADFFRFPASCCCHIKFTGNLATRIGIAVDKTSPQSPASRTLVSRIGETSSITGKK